MDIIDELRLRELIKDVSNEDELKELLKTKQTIYCGYDPSFYSLHLGNFVAISVLMRLKKAGHRIIGVVGGTTGLIGDPSGKKKERPLQAKETIFHNAEEIKKQLTKYLGSGDGDFKMVNNYDWLGEMTLIEFLRDYGKYFSINYMLNKDIVASRLDEGISFSEFSYSIIQAVDFLTLHQKEGCNIEIGGSDQWGNITSGLELIRKVEGNDAKVAAFTIPLLLDSSGKKFGKSEEGALYLNPSLCSPYRLYQYFINVGDADASRYLRIFSFKSLEEIDEIIKEHEANLGARIAQKALAYEVTSIIHGEEKAKEAVNMTNALFSSDISALSKENILELFGSFMVEHASGALLEDVLIDVKAAASKREAREFIKGNSIAINGQKVIDLGYIIDKKDALFDEYVLIKRGKKNYYLVKLV